MNTIEIEKKYKHELEKIDEWAYLRVKYYFAYRKEEKISKNSDNSNNQQKDITKKTFVEKLSAYKLLFYGFKNWFKRYDYIFITESGARKLIDNAYYNKNFDYIASTFKGDSLFIELANTSLYPIEKVYSKYIVNMKLINRVVYRLNKTIFLYKKKELKSRKDLNFLHIFDKYFNYIDEIHIYNTYVSLYKILFKIKKPKIVFVNCSYCNSYIIKAAHELNIKVVEAQHGLSEHAGYQSVLKLNESYFPNQFLSFGKREENIKNSVLTNIYPVGSFYLDYLNKNFEYDLKLKEIMNKYKITFSVTMMSVLEYEVIDFIKKVAIEKKDFLFILIPRFNKNHDIYIKYGLPSNVILYPKLDCYQLLMHSSIHTTIASTCAMEAPSMGVPNILLNIDEFVKTQYKSMLSKENPILSNKHTIIVQSCDEFIDAAKILSLNTNIKNIKNINSSIFLPRYNENIKKFIEKL